MLHDWLCTASPEYTICTVDRCQITLSRNFDIVITLRTYRLQRTQATNSRTAGELFVLVHMSRGFLYLRSCGCIHRILGYRTAIGVCAWPRFAPLSDKHTVVAS